MVKKSGIDPRFRHGTGIKANFSSSAKVLFRHSDFDAIQLIK
jgi:hypothetical protein